MPGPTDTDMNPASGEFAKPTRDHVALRRYATVDEVADFVAYLASPRRQLHHRSQRLPIDGGYSA